jgi:hypothetical protein
MISIKLTEFIKTDNGVDAYLRYREIEDWCHSRPLRGRWRFDYSSTICVCGIDIPGRIFFWASEDAIALKLKFPH